MTKELKCVVKVKSSICEIPRSDWDIHANPEAKYYNPFISYKFLKCLEDSGCVGIESGWVPHYLMLQNDKDESLGFMATYLKFHSQGEYVFDHGWADAYAQMGKAYYPKLQCSIPFSPVTGQRLLVKPGEFQLDHQKLLIAGAIQLLKKYEASSLHLTFLSQEEKDTLEKLGLLIRTDHQFHWYNNGYENFDDFLSSLSSRKRKAIRKERKEALVNDISIDRVSGSDLTETHWDHFFKFYMDTSDRKWGMPYLNREFFSHLNETMQNDILLMLCKRDGNIIAGALNFIGGDCLYGRYWGALEDHKYLHFETCYYQAIEYAIEHKLKRVEAGAQGQHKLARGYIPTTTYSAHYIADPYLNSAIADYLKRERKYVDKEEEILLSQAPYAKKT